VSVSITDVAGVGIGIEADAAEARLRRILGRPDSVRPLPGCTGEVGRWVTWSTLTVLFVDDFDTSRGVARLAGWSVSPGRARFRYVLPYGIATGTPIRTVLEQVPGAEEFTPPDFPGAYSVHTERTPHLSWYSSTSDRRGVVSDVEYHGFECD